MAARVAWRPCGRGGRGPARRSILPLAPRIDGGGCRLLDRYGLAAHHRTAHPRRAAREDRWRADAGVLLPMRFSARNSSSPPRPISRGGSGPIVPHYRERTAERGTDRLAHQAIARGTTITLLLHLHPELHASATIRASSNRTSPMSCSSRAHRISTTSSSCCAKCATARRALAAREGDPLRGGIDRRTGLSTACSGKLGHPAHSVSARVPTARRVIPAGIGGSTCTSTAWLARSPAVAWAWRYHPAGPRALAHIGVIQVLEEKWHRGRLRGRREHRRLRG